MEITDFTFIVTEACNFDCSYCYQAVRKGKRRGQKLQYLPKDTIEKAVDFLVPFFAGRCYVSFYGGEPLLAFEQIEHAVNRITQQNTGKDIRFSMTTNGSLIDDRILDFLDRYKFSILLSYDGTAQDIQRKKNSSAAVFAALKKVQQHPGIDLELNSVFTPDTVRYLASSVGQVLAAGVRSMQLSFSPLSDWDEKSFGNLEEELGKVRSLVSSFYRENGFIPLSDFREKTGNENKNAIFACYAGKTRLALAPDGKLWGCFLFWDYAKAREKTISRDYERYCFGDLDRFTRDYTAIVPGVQSHYAKLRMDHYCVGDGETFCMFCDDLEVCSICPINAAISGALIGSVPEITCRMKRMMREQKKLLWEELKQVNL